MYGHKGGGVTEYFKPKPREAASSSDASIHTPLSSGKRKRPLEGEPRDEEPTVALSPASSSGSASASSPFSPGSLDTEMLPSPVPAGAAADAAAAHHELEPELSPDAPEPEVAQVGHELTLRQLPWERCPWFDNSGVWQAFRDGEIKPFDLLDLTRPGEARWCRVAFEKPTELPSYLDGSRPRKHNCHTFYGSPANHISGGSRRSQRLFAPIPWRLRLS